MFSAYEGKNKEQKRKRKREEQKPQTNECSREDGFEEYWTELGALLVQLGEQI